ncbi:MAG TPA: excinuclease ABC subunit UvrC [Dehalococcoidia bacterium]|nr:excinuclease ABC subunit UvrC [Dehalococcoidia bacterium]
MVTERLLEHLKGLPTGSGVYIYRNSEGQVIYVGKAASLRNRVRSYFGSPRSLEPKTRNLVSQIDDLEWIVTSTAQEALILEATLVKRHQPYFNVRLKDDKHYPYLKIDLNEEWPRVEITRRVQNDGARYFGPYANSGSVRKTLDLVKKLFPWRSCTKIITGKDPRPCLDYYIHRCIGPCAALCTKEEYDEVIRQVILFLEGRSEEILTDLQREMEQAAEDEQFERAARIRDQIRAIERTTERQVMEVRERIDMDVFGLAREGPDSSVQVFFVRAGNVIGRDNFPLDGTVDEPDERVMYSFLEQFYESSTFIPKRILLPIDVPEQDLIAQWLSGKRGSKVELLAPQRGDKRALVETANANAREALQMARLRWLADTSKTQQALEGLQEELNLPELPKRIECYDISNIQGTSSVGSMVVCIDGKPRNTDYRRFQIKTVQGANDFASMQEVLKRRFRRAAEALRNGEQPGGGDESFGQMPDLVIVDGGKGQLSAAHDVMRDMGLGHVPLAGLAKRFEELYVVDMSEPIVLPRTSQALYLVQRIRDEAHRFAITYHRNLRGKSSVKSALDTIPGVGPKRKKALLRKFGSIKAIREADLADIAATPGFTTALAEKVRSGL